MPLLKVTDDDFADRVLACERPIVLDFWADWCPPCRAIEPVLADLAEEYEGRLVIAKMNSDENPVTARAYRVLSLPTLLVFRGGEVAASMVGARSKSALRQAFSAHIGDLTIAA